LEAPGTQAHFLGVRLELLGAEVGQSSRRARRDTPRTFSDRGRSARPRLPCGPGDGDRREVAEDKLHLLAAPGQHLVQRRDDLLAEGTVEARGKSRAPGWP